MKPLRIIIALLVVFLFAAGCKKDKLDVLPPATQEGKNTMGCRVNGVVKVYSGVLTYNRPHGVMFGYAPAPGNYATIIGDSKARRQDGSVYLYFYANPLKPDTLYSYLGSPTGLSQYNTGSIEYRVKAHDTYNYVKFTRIDDKVAAGIFQFRGYTSGGDSVYVTEGRFDIAR